MQCWINLKLCVVSGNSPVNCSLLMLQTIHVCIDFCWYSICCISINHCIYCISLCLSVCFLLLSLWRINVCIIPATAAVLGLDRNAQSTRHKLHVTSSVKINGFWHFVPFYLHAIILIPSRSQSDTVEYA